MRLLHAIRGRTLIAVLFAFCLSLSPLKADELPPQPSLPNDPVFLLLERFARMAQDVYHHPSQLESWFMPALIYSVIQYFPVKNAWQKFFEDRRQLKGKLEEKKQQLRSERVMLNAALEADLGLLNTFSETLGTGFRALGAHIESIRAHYQNITPPRSIPSGLRIALDEWRDKGSTQALKDWLETKAGKRFIRENPQWQAEFQKLLTAVIQDTHAFVGAFEHLNQRIRDNLPNSVPATRLVRLESDDSRPGQLLRTDRRGEQSLIAPSASRDDIRRNCRIPLARLAADIRGLESQLSLSEMLKRTPYIRSALWGGALTSAVGLYAYMQHKNGKDYLEMRDDAKKQAERTRQIEQSVAGEVASKEGRAKLEKFYDIVKDVLGSHKGEFRQYLEAQFNENNFGHTDSEAFKNTVNESLESFGSKERVQAAGEKALVAAGKAVEQPSLDHILLLLNSKDIATQDLRWEMLDRFYSSMTGTLLSKVVFDGNRNAATQLPRELKSKLIIETIRRLQPEQLSPIRPQVPPAPGIREGNKPAVGGGGGAAGAGAQ